MKFSAVWAARGKMFAFEHFDFHPDIVAIAKGIASGMPLGVTMAPLGLMTWEPGAHASTFGGNPVCLAAALETVRLVGGEICRECGESRTNF